MDPTLLSSTEPYSAAAAAQHANSTDVNFERYSFDLPNIQKKPQTLLLV